MKSLICFIGLLYLILEIECRKRGCRRPPIPHVCDYIVVGAGAGGVPVAARLSEDPDVTVCLFEAGPDDNSAGVITPRLWTGIGPFPGELKWNHTTVPQKGLYNREIFVGMGRQLGGSTSQNTMVYFRGFKDDFDLWEATGAKGWNFNDVLPYFRKFENFDIPGYPDDECGPVTITQNPEIMDRHLYKLFRQTATENYMPIVKCNDKTPYGLCSIHSTISDGFRESTYLAYLKPIMGRRNLQVIPDALVGKIMISKKTKRAYGVKVMRDGQIKTVRARREIVVSGGTFESAKLLQLSGIGPRKLLRKLGIREHQDLPVGENLQGHLVFLMDISVDVSTIGVEYLRDPDVLAEYIFQRKGVYSESGTDFNIFWDLEKQKRFNTPEVQLMFFGSRTLFGITSYNVLNAQLPEPGNIPQRNGTTVLFFLSHPKSRGTVKAKSRDPKDLPVIDQKFLTNPYDVKMLIKAIRKLQIFVKSPSMRAANAELSIFGYMPDACKLLEADSDDQWECILRIQGLSGFHPVSTCKMGGYNDRTAVVDPYLRVKGIDGLRIADASVMPETTSANTMSPTIMIGERAADFIKKKNSMHG